MYEAVSSHPSPRWSQRAVCWIFSKVTSGHRIRLDFSDGTRMFLGPESETTKVAVRPPTFWRTLWIFLKPGLRAGESFVRGDWTVTEGDVAAFLKMTQIPRRGFYARLYLWIADWRGPAFFFRQRLFPKWNRRDLPKHYDAGNELYTRMLGPTAQYSCAFFSLSQHGSLDAAQQAKLTASIERLHLTAPALRVLDIGCGWGALAAEIARQPGNHEVVGITLSQEQLGEALLRRTSLPANVRSRLDYYLRDYDTFLARSAASFDRIISIGMFEHVGFGRHVHYFKSIERSLTPGGRALVHSIVRPSPGSYNEWIRRYVFPGSFLPSVAEMISAAEKTNLIVDAVHLHPPTDYRRTIQVWRQRLDRAWPELERENPEKYNLRFKRLWIFYLAGVETLFTEDLMNYRIAQVELRKLDGSIGLAA
jgi:cyclopropane-fatty-acyl-phospholipid synthase